MAEHLLPILTKFHREIILPDMQRMFGELRGEMDARFREVYEHFDEIHKRFDRLETKCLPVRAARTRYGTPRS